MPARCRLDAGADAPRVKKRARRDQRGRSDTAPVCIAWGIFSAGCSRLHYVPRFGSFLRKQGSDGKSNREVTDMYKFMETDIPVLIDKNKSRRTLHSIRPHRQWH